jgi:hypothetical protein
MESEVLFDQSCLDTYVRSAKAEKSPLSLPSKDTVKFPLIPLPGALWCPGTRCKCSSQVVVQNQLVMNNLRSIDDIKFKQIFSFGSPSSSSCSQSWISIAHKLSPSWSPGIIPRRFTTAKLQEICYNIDTARRAWWYNNALSLWASKFLNDGRWFRSLKAWSLGRETSASF